MPSASCAPSSSKLLADARLEAQSATTVAPAIPTTAALTTTPSTPPTTTSPPTTVRPTTVPPTTAPPTTVPPTTAPPPTVPPQPVFAPGDPVARLEIPRIGVDEIVVSGVGVEDLKKGPGHYPETPLPGQPGNAAIAGHRTTYGAPFFSVDELAPGDKIIATTFAGRFVYRVTGTVVVAPTDVGVIAGTADARLTLTSCHPLYSAANRIVVTAQLDAERSAPIATVPPPAPDKTPRTDHRLRAARDRRRRPWRRSGSRPRRRPPHGTARPGVHDDDGPHSHDGRRERPA